MKQKGAATHTSTLAASACSSMNTRRGSTLSPMSSSKMVLASSISLTLTWRSERALVSSVVSQSWLGIHLAEAFVALQRDALAAGRR